ncbi:extracellular solute-binding protein [Actinomadura sp. KC216]|uniref:extracellular solute-binding protein n=1 Tax=Actinomadura sp. KC216 TaxID=2530370 RepID=UPI0014047127|nr:extracellular solute-binding protein [Actinomadura sp. KC216]
MKLNGKLALGAICSATVVLTAACGSGPGASGGSGDDLSGARLVFVNFGGDGLAAAKKAWLDPFSKKTGVRFATDSPSDPAKVKAMVEAGNPTWDMIDLDVGSGRLGCGTLYEKRSPEVDVSAVDPALLSDDCGVPIMLQTMALVYNADRFGANPPTKITDFLDTARYPGKRITLNYAAGGIEGMLLSGGVEPKKLYPLDLARAARAVQGLGGDFSPVPTIAGQSQALESGDFAMCWCYLGRAALSEERGAKLGVVWQNALSGWDMLYAIKGSKSPKAQQALLDHVATPAAQAAFTEQLPYGPTTPSAEPNLPAGRAKWLSKNNMDKIGEMALIDPKWWNANTAKAFAAWTEMTAG